MAGKQFIAVDLGASSGRVMRGALENGKLRLEEMHRFANGPIEESGHQHWDVPALYGNVLKGLSRTAAAGYTELAGIGVDTWGVDFGLIGRHDVLLGNPFMYRDGMTDGMIERAFEMVPKKVMYEITGNQFLQFNTIFQLLSLKESGSPLLEKADQLLFMPDLFHFLLTGEKRSEYTIATTSQLLDSRSRTWSIDLVKQLGLPEGLLGPIIPPGTVLGPLKGSVLRETGLAGAVVTAPASHDTASAVAAVPAGMENWAYISSGTWSLIGVEVSEPVISGESLAANFTNEGGVNGSIRFLSNSMGLWILQRCLAEWNREKDYDEILRQAADADPFKTCIYPDDPLFLNPESMTAAIDTHCRRTGQPLPETQGAYVRAVLESLAFRYREIIQSINKLRNNRIEILHIVGGGSQNELLNRFTAAAAGIPVLAGPVEATAAGNIIVQAVAAGELASIEEGRAVIRASFPMRRSEPDLTEEWDEAFERYRVICKR